MYIKAVAVTLPNPDYVYTLHSHAYETHAAWQESDRQGFEELYRAVEYVYGDPKRVKEFPKELQPAIYNPDLNKGEALQKLVPMMVTADRQKRTSKVLHRVTDEVALQGYAGGANEPGGFFQIVISRGAGFEPVEEVLSLIAREHRLKNPKAIGSDGRSKQLSEFSEGDELMDGNSGARLSLDSIEVRTNMRLVGFVRNATKSLSSKGYLKVVLVPNDIEPILTRNRGGEVVTERARIWN